MQNTLESLVYFVDANQSSWMDVRPMKQDVIKTNYSYLLHKIETLFKNHKHELAN